MKYEFNSLPYSYDALEPYIDAQTMELHHSKHHKTYYDRFVAAIADSDFNGKPLEEIFANMSKLPAALRNHGGGYYNHDLFWNIMSAKGGGEAKGALKNNITEVFGSFEAFQDQFNQAATNRFGSGWAWLSLDKNGKLFVSSTANQDNPLMDTESTQGQPIIGLDVWEHAYYLKYQNRRPEYISAFWNVIDWEKASEVFETKLALL